MLTTLLFMSAAQYPDDPESFQEALDELLDDPDFLDAVADELLYQVCKDDTPYIASAVETTTIAINT